MCTLNNVAFLKFLKTSLNVKYNAASSGASGACLLRLRGEVKVLQGFARGLQAAVCVSGALLCFVRARKQMDSR